MKYKKLCADCNKELMALVVRAVEKEKRTLSNFIRLACEEKANEILKEENGNTKP